MTEVDTGDARVRVAIIGSGPAGSYAAGQLLSHSATELHVDLFERLPTPWGLVRAGVAPDHPKIKSVTVSYTHLDVYKRQVSRSGSIAASRRSELYRRSTRCCCRR